ncbi:MAG: hypothetical protein P4L33_13315 [Capsulimonadaceae bacterium]|nr:hypothetical protein [Capsulimonadaceae bacterium]
MQPYTVLSGSDLPDNYGQAARDFCRLNGRFKGSENDCPAVNDEGAMSEHNAVFAENNKQIIEMLRRDDLLDNDVKLILLGKLDALYATNKLTRCQFDALCSLLGGEFVKENAASLELAAYGCLDIDLAAA